MHSSILASLSAAKEEALQIMLRGGEIEERREVRQRRSNSLAHHQPKKAACVKCGDMLNLSARIRCKSIACSASCCRAVGAACKHHCVASGEVGQQQGPPTCVNCGVSVKDNTAKRLPTTHATQHVVGQSARSASTTASVARRTRRLGLASLATRRSGTQRLRDAQIMHAQRHVARRWALPRYASTTTRDGAGLTSSRLVG